jgi:hypothetical protein
VTTSMRVVPFDSAQESALAAARRLRVMLDYVLVQHEQGLQEDRAHRRALHAGVVKASAGRGVAHRQSRPIPSRAIPLRSATPAGWCASG